MDDFAPRPVMIPPAEADYDAVVFGAEARVAYLPAESAPPVRRHRIGLRHRRKGAAIVEAFVTGPASALG